MFVPVAVAVEVLVEVQAGHAVSVRFAVGVAELLGVSVIVEVAVAVATITPQGLVRPTVLAMSVTCPLSANSLPSTTAPEFNVIEVLAIIVPLKELDDPRVADDPTAQKILLARAPFTKLIPLEEPVTNDEFAWKI